MTLIEQRPSSAPPRQWRFPSFERRQLDSGLDLVLCHLPGRPIAAARLILEAGAVAEPMARAGVALLAARALPEGTESLDSHRLAEVMEGMGAAIRAEVSYDTMQVRLDVPASRLGPALEMLADVARRPAFRAADVERLRNERLDQLAQEKTVPELLAARAFDQAVFVPDSPYARAIGGDESTVEGLDCDAIADFYRSRLEAGAALVVAGDLSGVDVAGIAASAFGQWPAAAGARPAPVVDEVDAPRRVIVVDRPESVQSALAIGHAGPPRNTPDYVAVGTMAMCLGGVFGSRLNMKLREEKAYTYGAHAGFDFRRDGGSFAARTAVQSQSTGDAVADTIGEITRTAAEGIPESELAPVRDYRIGIFPIAYERPGAVAAGLAELVVHDLPPDYFDSVRDKIAGVTSDDVSAAAARHLHPDKLAVVVVGDESKVGDSLG
jgi:zinc protease